MKKNWNNPEFNQLGMKNTEEQPSFQSIGDNTQPPVGWVKVRCDLCGGYFTTAEEYNKHKTNGDGVCDYTSNDSKDHVTYLWS